MKDILVIIFMAPVDLYLWVVSHLLAVRISVQVED
jgi:hypothetical protein